MPLRRHHYTWDDIPWLDADVMASWGAFEPGAAETLDFGDERKPNIAFAMELERLRFIATYVWPGSPPDAAPIRSIVGLVQRPCRFGGSRAYFSCPSCHGRKLRLAVLPRGLMCGDCGMVTYASRRATPTQRLIRKADRIAWRMGLDSWEQPPTRPPYMRVEMYQRLLQERETVVAEIHRRIARRLKRRGYGDLLR